MSNVVFNLFKYVTFIKIMPYDIAIKILIQVCPVKV